MRGSTKNNNAFFYVKIKGLKKEDKKPYFEFQKKEGENYEIVDTQSELTGCIDGPIKIKHYEFENRDCVEYKVTITDDACAETYILSLGNSGISRNILNSIISLDMLIEPLKISLYLSKGKDGKEYKQVSIRSNLTEEFIPWKFSIVELNSMMEPIKDKKGVTIKNDTSKLDEFIDFAEDNGYDYIILPDYKLPFMTSKRNILSKIDRIKTMCEDIGWGKY